MAIKTKACSSECPSHGERALRRRERNAPHVIITDKGRRKSAQSPSPPTHTHCSLQIRQRQINSPKRTQILPSNPAEFKQGHSQLFSQPTHLCVYMLRGLACFCLNSKSNKDFWGAVFEDKISALQISIKYIWNQHTNTTGNELELGTRSSHWG